MTLLALTLAATLGATPTLVDERPLWAGALRAGAPSVVVSAVPGALRVRSSTSSVDLAADATNALGASLCPGATPVLAIPAGSSLLLLGEGAPGALVARVSLPAQAVSGAVPVVDGSGCRHAVALASGDVALVGPSGALQSLAGVIPAVLDWHELPRGVLIASREDLLVVGGVDGSLAAIRLSDGQRYQGSVPVAAVPGAAWSDAEATLWFLARNGSLHAWRVLTEAPQLLQAGTTAAPGGLVAWGGRSDHGLAWADLQGQVLAWRDGALRTLARLPTGVRWPLLVADLDDSGDLKLVAAVDGSVAALVTEDASGGSFQLLPLGGRPAGPPVAYQLTVDDPPVLAIPVGATRAALQRADTVPAGQLVHDGAVLVSGTQVRGSISGPMTAGLLAPAGSPTGPVVSGPTGPTGGAGTTGGASQTSTAKSGFSCATASGTDTLALLLLPLALLRRRVRGSRATGRTPTGSR